MKYFRRKKGDICVRCSSFRSLKIPMTSMLIQMVFFFRFFRTADGCHMAIHVKRTHRTQFWSGSLSNDATTLLIPLIRYTFMLLFVRSGMIFAFLEMNFSISISASLCTSTYYRSDSTWVFICRYSLSHSNVFVCATIFAYTSLCRRLSRTTYISNFVQLKRNRTE